MIPDWIDEAVEALHAPIRDAMAEGRWDDAWRACQSARIELRRLSDGPYGMRESERVAEVRAIGDLEAEIVVARDDARRGRIGR